MRDGRPGAAQGRGAGRAVPIPARPSKIGEVRLGWAGPHASAQKEPPRRNAGGEVWSWGNSHRSGPRCRCWFPQISPARIDLDQLEHQVVRNPNDLAMGLVAADLHRVIVPRGMGIAHGRGWTTVCVRDRCHRPIPTAPRDGTLKGLPRSVAPTRRRGVVRKPTPLMAKDRTDAHELPPPSGIALKNHWQTDAK
jgi:hypothetical protein